MTRAAQTVARDNRLRDWSSVRRALLIRLRSIGDTVLMTPCLDALKSWRPDIHITALLEPLSAPVLEDHPMVDELLVVERSVSSRARLVVELRRRRFDIAFNMHGGTTATILARLSGARRAVGYGDYSLSWLLNERAPSPDRILGRTDLHSAEQQLALLGWAGVPWPDERPRLSLRVSAEAEAGMRERLARMEIDFEGKGFVALAAAAALESKRWPAEGFAAVSDYLYERWDLPCAVIAGPGQEHIAREVAARSRAGTKVITGLGLKELMALLGLAKIFVGNDSGPMHIAAALKRPIVALFGSSNADVWHPWTESPYRVLRADAYAKKTTGKAAISDSESDYLIRRIPVGDVIAAVDEIMESGASPAPADLWEADRAHADSKG